jgi:hypothetical protein
MGADRDGWKLVVATWDGLTSGSAAVVSAGSRRTAPDMGSPAGMEIGRTFGQAESDKPIRFRRADLGADEQVIELDRHAWRLRCLTRA